MDFLARNTVDLPQDLWDAIDHTVKETASRSLVARRFLDLYGPLGPTIQGIQIDTATVEETAEDGYIKTAGRRFVELPTIYEDFTLGWRDLEASDRNGLPLDLTAVKQAARQLALKEDRLIFFGNEFLATDGLLNADGVTHLVREDWGEGEHAFSQIAQGIAMLSGQYLIGRYVLVVSPDVYAELFRIQPQLGRTEAERLTELLGGNLFNAPVLGNNKAVLLCAEAENMDLVIGKDMATAYLETAGLNHRLRILETAALRLKNKDAVIVFD